MIETNEVIIDDQSQTQDQQEIHHVLQEQQEHQQMEENRDFLSNEKVPDSWPEEFPGITKFAEAEPTASLQFNSSDIVLINTLASLAPGALIDEMKSMRSIACKLAVEEEQEKKRGRILRVLLN